MIDIGEQELREKLLKHKVALQPNKQPIIWKTLCLTIENDFDGDIRKLFSNNGYSVQTIKEYIGNYFFRRSWTDECAGNCCQALAGASKGNGFSADRCTYTYVVVEQRKV